MTYVMDKVPTILNKIPWDTPRPHLMLAVGLLFKWYIHFYSTTLEGGAGFQVILSPKVQDCICNVLQSVKTILSKIVGTFLIS